MKNNVGVGTVPHIAPTPTTVFRELPSKDLKYNDYWTMPKLGL